MRPDPTWARQLAEQLAENIRRAGADPDAAEAWRRSYERGFHPLPLPGRDVVVPELDENGGIKGTVTKFNPYHMPAGSPEGGQFTSAPSDGGTVNWGPPASLLPRDGADNERLNQGRLLLDRLKITSFQAITSLTYAERHLLNHPQSDEDIAVTQAVIAAARERILGLMDLRSEAEDDVNPAWNESRPSDDQLAVQKTYMDDALKRLPAIMVAEVAANLTGIQMYEDEGSMTAALYPKGRPFQDNSLLGGAVTTDRDYGVRLHLDSGAPVSWGGTRDEALGYYLHELGHVLDASVAGGLVHHGIVSGFKPWERAWNEEIAPMTASLTAYARTSAAEGFAEYIRLVGQSPREAKDLYPKAWQVLVDRGWM